MPILKPLIDVVTLGSEHPIRRLVGYYVILGLIMWGLASFFPESQNLILGRGVDTSMQVPAMLQDGLSSTPSASLLGVGSLAELAITTTVILM